MPESGVETDPRGRPVERARSPWAVFAWVAVTQFMVVLDASIVYIALPTIQHDLGFSHDTLPWVMDAYLLAFGGFMLIGGRAADLFGARRVLAVGLMVFCVASLICGVSVTAWMLVAARVVQGLAAAVISPAAMTSVTHIFPEGPDRHKALGLFGGIGGLAGATGVLLGGLLTALAWQAAFLVNVPVSLVILLVGVRQLPEGRHGHGGGVDVVGAVTSTGGLCLLLYAVLRGGSLGWGAAQTLGFLAAAVVLLGAFVARQLTAGDPLVPRVLFRLRNVVLGNVANTAVGVLMFGVFYVVSLYLQQVRGYSPLNAAVRTVPISLALFIGSQVAVRAFSRVNPVVALAAGLALQGAGLGWWQGALGASGDIVTSFVLPGIVWGFGVGTSIVGAFVVSTSGVHGPMAGAASGLVNTTLQIGGAVGVALMTTVGQQRTAGLLAHHTAATTAMASGQVDALAAGLVVAVLALPPTLWLLRRPRRRPPGGTTERNPTEAVPVA